MTAVRCSDTVAAAYPPAGRHKRRDCLGMHLGMARRRKRGVVAVRAVARRSRARRPAVAHEPGADLVEPAVVVVERRDRRVVRREVRVVAAAGAAAVARGHDPRAPAVDGPVARDPGCRACSAEPALVVTRLVGGGPLDGDWMWGAAGSHAQRLGSQLATFLARLHDIDAGEVLRELPIVTPTPQASTVRLRRRFPGWWTRPSVARPALVRLGRGRPRRPFATTCPKCSSTAICMATTSSGIRTHPRWPPSSTSRRAACATRTSTCATSPGCLAVSTWCSRRSTRTRS